VTVVLTIRGVKRWVFTQEYRFRLGQSFLVFVNFSLLVTAASSKLEWISGLGRTRHVLLLLVPLAFVGVWVCGWVMDRIVNAPKEQARISNNRNPAIVELLDNTREILRRLEGK